MATLVDGVRPAGEESVTWDAAQFSAGVYYYSLEAIPVDGGGKGYTSVRKMLLIK